MLSQTASDGHGRNLKLDPFSAEFKYLGFFWNLPIKTVQVPEQKKLCYLEKLEPWQKGQKFSKKNIIPLLLFMSYAPTRYI